MTWIQHLPTWQMVGLSMLGGILLLAALFAVAEIGIRITWWLEDRSE